MSRFLFLSLCLALLGSGCGLDVIEVEVTETGVVGLTGLNFPGMPQFSASLGRALTDKDVKPSDVDSLRLVRARLSHLSVGVMPPDLAFLHDVRLEASAAGQPTARLAEQAAFAPGTIQADLPTADLELKPYLDTGAMRLGLEATADPPPMAAIELELKLRFRVDVNVI
jgi:hypothetical protein